MNTIAYRGCLSRRRREQTGAHSWRVWPACARSARRGQPEEVLSGRDPLLTCRHRRRSFGLTVFLFLFWTFSFAQVRDDGQTCRAEIESLRDSAPFSTLPKSDQTRILRALSDDIAEMGELDLVRSYSSRAAYRNYFVSRLEFKTLPAARDSGRLLLIRYNSNTMCDFYENCPVWIVHITHSTAQTMVPWQEELGTSAGGGWGVGAVQTGNLDFPDLILLTHLSANQTGLACYHESKGQYRRGECSANCIHLLQQPQGSDQGR